MPAGGGRKKACDTTGTETNDGKLSEHAFTLDVALRLQRLLAAAGATVVMTRTTDDGVGPCVDRRVIHVLGIRLERDLRAGGEIDSPPEHLEHRGHAARAEA